MIFIADYGMGNLGSIESMLWYLGHSARISAQADDVRTAERLILPGVGAFDTAVERLRRDGLQEAVAERVRSGTPTLAICLGMQLLGRKSEEGQQPGLGLLPCETVKFRFPAERTDLKVPHMGWASVTPQRRHPLWDGLESGARFYFVHSFHVRCDSADDVLATADHGGTFHASIGRDNLMATQFHPEKSHRFGLKLLDNFARWA